MSCIPACMWIKDDQGNDIKTSKGIFGSDEPIKIHQFNHAVKMPKKVKSIGDFRVHKNLKIAKPFDASSPFLYHACMNGINLKEIIIKWYQINEKGELAEFFIHKIENAKIVSIKTILPNIKDPLKTNFYYYEKVTFCFKKITWIFVEGDIEYSEII
ncbi:type VI secretion system tube protein Hcp [candidate division KSB1 bacterium]|nr:type VI secretion system tube protein Hcp [candidate division KSB1 bacterium]